MRCTEKGKEKEYFKMERHTLLNKRAAFGVLGQSSFRKVVRTEATLLWIEEKVWVRGQRHQVRAPPR